MNISKNHTVRSRSFSLFAQLAPLMVVLMLLSAGCVAESPLGYCPPEPPEDPDFRLTFHYTFNATGHDTLAEDVRSIEIYVFDSSTGLLTSVVDVSPSDISRGWVEIEGLDDGEYTFVAWGVSDDDLAGSFAVRHMTDPESGEHSPLEVGVTTLDEFYMMLGCEASRGGRGEVASSVGDFDDLFHSVACNVLLTRAEGATVDFDFVRNTSTLRVAVTGLEHLAGATTRADTPAAPPSLFALGNNGRHRWDNSIDPWAGTVKYTPGNMSLTPGTMSGDIHIMRLDVSRHTGDDSDPVLLCLQSESGDEIIPPLDILSAIGRIRGLDGQLLYGTQEAIDRQEEFRIVIAISPVEPPEPPEPPDDPDPVRVTGVELTPRSLTLEVGDSGRLTATLFPSNATNKSVTWTSSDETIATVDAGGVVRAIREGTVTITVITADGEYIASCTVSVIPDDPGTDPDPDPDPVWIGYKVTITINDWKVVDLDPIVEPWK